MPEQSENQICPPHHEQTELKGRCIDRLDDGPAQCVPVTVGCISPGNGRAGRYESFLGDECLDGN